MFKEFDAAGFEGFGVFDRPNRALRLCKYRRAVLHNEVEIRVNLGQLKAEST